MSPKFPRLVLLAMLATGFAIAPAVSASAAGGESSWLVHNMPTGFNDGPAGNRHDVAVNDTVLWYVTEGKHNITPAEDVPGGQKWGGQKPSGDLTPDSTSSDPLCKNAGGCFAVKFTKAGLYYFYSDTGGEGADDHGDLSGMWGVVNVKDPNATTTTTAAPTTTTTQAPTTTTAPPPPPGTTATTAPAAVGPAAVHTPSTVAPAPTTTTAKPAKDKNKKEDPSTSSSSTAPPPPTAPNLSADNIVPNVTPDGSATQNGVVAPSSTPSGDAIATLPEKPHSTKGVKLLIATGVGIFGLGIGAAGYKYAHRASKYFPA